MSSRSDSFLTLEQLAGATGLPRAWLRAEAGAQRIPSLKVGRRTMFNLEQVQRALLSRTIGDPEAQPKPPEVSHA